jgi:tRNA-binding protein
MTSKTAFMPAPIKKLVSAEDVDKLDVRVERVDDVPQSKKLIKLTVNFGDHSRTILVGMKGEHANPDKDLLNKQALFVVNVAPMKMAGELSEGMLFDIGYGDGLSPILAVPEKRVANGARAG